MNLLQHLFASPEWHAFEMNLQRRTITFARLSPQEYEEYVFLGTELAEDRGVDLYELRLDDVLLAAAGLPSVTKPIHYILHTAFCCSTLLARYFELLPECFVMKEPQLLAQMGLIPDESVATWHDMFSLSIRLLSRTYRPEQLPVIKAHVPTNILGKELLRQNHLATIVFLINPMRDFLLSALKSRQRRGQIRFWNHYTAMQAAHRIPQLATVSPDELTDAEAAAYWWLVNRFLCSELSSGEYRARVLVVDGRQLTDSPERVLPGILELCGLPFDKGLLERLINHPSIHKHSKHPSMFYDAESRRQEMADLEFRYAREADKAMAWAALRGMEDTSLEPFTQVSAHS
jgi:hypothetical protein